MNTTTEVKIEGLSAIETNKRDLIPGCLYLILYNGKKLIVFIDHRKEAHQLGAKDYKAGSYWSADYNLYVIKKLDSVTIRID